MTIEILESYYQAGKRIEVIEDEIRDLEKPVHSPNGNESIGSRPMSPGDPTASTAMRIIELKEDLERQKAQLNEQRAEVDAWLRTANAEISNIAYWHYVKRLSWKKTNFKVFGYYDYRYAKRKIERYFKNAGNISDRKL